MGNNEIANILEVKFKYFEKYMNEKFNGFDKQFEGLKDDINELKSNEKTHYINCPHQVKNEPFQKKVEKIENDLLEYRFIKKYPKIFIVVVVVLTLLTAYNIYAVQSKLYSSEVIEQQKDK